MCQLVTTESEFGNFITAVDVKWASCRATEATINRSEKYH